MKVTTLYEVLQQSLEKFSTRTAFSLWRGAGVTFSEVGERVKQIQDMLVDADIQPGDRVAILSSSVPNWGVAYFAIASAGYVVVPIMPDFTSEDIDRIVEMHISPVNVSVHTTNPQLRCQMLRNDKAGESLELMRRFAKAGITMNCQIVCCLIQAGS